MKKSLLGSKRLCKYNKDQLKADFANPKDKAIHGVIGYKSMIVYGLYYFKITML